MDERCNILSLSFNQDNSSIIFGTRCGYHCVSLNHGDQLCKIHGLRDCELFIAERSFLSSLMVFVSFSSPRQLRFHHIKKNSEALRPVLFDNSILAVKLNRQRIVVILSTVIFIYSGSSPNFMEELHRIRSTQYEFNGICALAASDESSLLAYCHSMSIGEVILYDTNKFIPQSTLRAHENPIAQIAFDYDGNRLASASAKGTIVRVHSTHDGTLMYEFRRGKARCAQICSLIFSTDDKYLCCASQDTETIHIFRLEDGVRDTAQRDKRVESFFDTFTRLCNDYLPYNVTNLFTLPRSFAKIQLPTNFPSMKYICAMTTVRQKRQIVVASNDGYIYLYNINEESGGYCDLVQQYSLDQMPLENN